MSAATLLQLRGLRQPLQALRDAALLTVDRAFTSSAAVLRFRSLAPPPVRPPEAPIGQPQPDLVDKYLSEACMSSADVRKAHLQRVVADFQRFPGDTGSTEVQVALLTEKISALAQHMQQHRKDFSTRRGLEGMLSQRRKLLEYLRRTDFDTYAKMLSRLGLKDTYAKQDRLTKYKTGGRAQ